MIGRRLPLISIGAALLVAAGLSLAAFATRSEAVGPSAPNQMALDATSGGAVNATRSVSGTTAFNVGIHVTNVGNTPYKGYQWQIEYPLNGIDFAGNTVEAPPTGFTTCTAPSNADGVLDPVNNDTDGNGAGCLSLGVDSSLLVGQWTTFDLQCVADGTFTVFLLDTDEDVTFFGATLLDATGAALDTGTTDMTITCTDTNVTLPTATPTNTPAATNTPVPATPTNTPCTGASCPTATATLPRDFTRTATPSSATPATTPAPTEPTTGGTPPPPPGATSTRPAGGPGGVIAGPDTGNGGYLADDGSANLSTIAILVALAPVVIALGSRKRGSSK